MSQSLVPRKTADGQAELAQRARGLGQRYRTVLLLVDGRRRWDEVQTMAAAAGVSSQCLEELVAWGLVAMSVPAPGPGAVGEPTIDSSVMPPMRSLAPDDSAWPPPSAAAELGFDGVDRPLEEARDLLIKAVRAEAPVAGSLTLMRLRRAANRNELAALLDEVEQRIRKPHKQIMAAQTLRHVRHLLSLPLPAA